MSMASSRALSTTRRSPPDPIYTLIDKTSTLLENLIQDITRPLSLRRRFSMNRTQTGLSIAILATMMMPILSDIVFKWIIQVPFLDYVFLILSLLLFLISFLGYVIVNVHQDFRLLSHSERAVLGPVMARSMR